MTVQSPPAIETMRGGSTLDVFQSARAGECFNNLLRPMLQLIGAVEKEVMSGATLRETNSGGAQALESDPAGKIRFCPNRSPRAPATKVRAANGRSSAFVTHYRSSGDRRESRLIAASATRTRGRYPGSPRRAA